MPFCLDVYTRNLPENPVCGLATLVTYADSGPQYTHSCKQTVMTQTIHLRLQIIRLLISFILAKQGWENIQPAASCQDQTKALQGLLKRNIPQEFWFYFDLSVSEDCQLNSPKLYGSVNIISRPFTNGTNQIIINGNSGVSVAFGLNHYLK